MSPSLPPDSSMQLCPPWKYRIPASYVIRCFISMLLTTYQFPLSWTTWIQYTLSYSFSSKFSVILSSHLLLVLPLDHFPSAVPITICQQVYSSPFVTHVLPDLVTTIIFGEEYKLCLSWLHNPSLLLLGSSVNTLFKSLGMAVAKLSL